MSFPLSSADGAAISSWAGTFYANLLSKLGPMDFDIQVTGADDDVTQVGATTHAGLAGLKSWVMNARAHAFATPRQGAEAGLFLSFNPTGQQVLHVESAEIELTSPVLDITSHAGSGGPVWSSHRPEAISGRWRYLCKVDSETAPSDLPDIGDALPTATFTYGAEDTTPNTLAGSVIVNSRRINKAAKQLSTIEYGGIFTGNITPAGTTSLFGSSALAVPEWPEGTAEATLLTITDGVRSLAGDAFWSRLRVTWGVRAPVLVELTAQGTGALAAPA